MKILVLSANYPRPDGYVAQYFIHTRNKEYVKRNIDVSVLSFSTNTDYVLDEVKVYSYKSYKEMLISTKFDILVSHAPNLRNHYLFLKKYNKMFNKFVFFFHGGEVLKSSEIYPMPYPYTKKASKLYSAFNNLYDDLKLRLWKQFFIKYAEKSKFVFVSNWMYEMFIRFVKIKPSLIQGSSYIIYNSSGKKFELNKYNAESKKEYDFITIRNILDKSKYCIDVVNNMAKNNPSYKFCVVGKGEYFNYNEKASNLDFISSHLNHDKIIQYLNKSKYALMPTRADAQGVMACEMATFGIPVITSNISVCKEVLGDFDNVKFIDNDDEIFVESLNLDFDRNVNSQKDKKFFTENTIGKEVELFNNIIGE
ncbi:glycosyltransferase [Lederbergia citrea]|uniref:Glycosyltransferase family 4 protein n=1 Tax=Lederbergia citrea TaxID=2833581 RepID=A0A942Z471_9BACI|nr:glycosyltransferase [Lederbergia citrea]MBS4223349.1 glycosyltransferase family 4 protein [Lederbergia citrea]